MSHEAGPRATEHQFFTSLLDGNSQVLNRLLSDDFVLVDVMSGGETPKSALLAVIGSGQLKFDSIEPADARVRIYGPCAVIVGRTHMNGRFEQTPFAVHSRYTHVYFEQDGQWQMVAAQGTPIAQAPSLPRQ